MDKQWIGWATAVILLIFGAAACTSPPETPPEVAPPTDGPALILFYTDN